MSRDLKVAIPVFLASFVIFIAVALLVGPDVDVNSSVVQTGHSSGRYMLHIDRDDEAGVLRFTVVDTREGYTYIFDRDNAETIIPPTEAGEPEADSAPEN